MVASFFDLVLCNVLVEHLFVEFNRVLLGKFVIELTTMGFDNVTLAWGRAVSESVILLGLEVVLVEYLVARCSVLEADQSLSRRRMLAVIWTLTMELINNCVKVLLVSLFSVCLHFTHKS